MTKEIKPKPKTFSECERRNCHRCEVYIKGTISSISFASRFQKDDCYTRRSLPRRYRSSFKSDNRKYEKIIEENRRKNEIYIEDILKRAEKYIDSNTNLRGNLREIALEMAKLNAINMIKSDGNLGEYNWSDLVNIIATGFTEKQKDMFSKLYL